MTVIGAAALGLVGVYLGMRWLASLYLLLDLHYTRHSAWPRIIRAITLWSGAPVLLAIVLPENARAALWWGFTGFIGYYVVVALLLSEVLIPRLLSARPR